MRCHQLAVIALIALLPATCRVAAQPKPAVPPPFPTGETWQAAWIWGHEPTHGAHGYFRKEITVRERPASAWAQFSGDDGYTLYVNGVEVRTGGFWWKTTDRADIRGLLHPGANVLAAHIRNYAHPGGFLLQADLAYRDGSSQVEATGPSWWFRSSEPPAGWNATAGPLTGWEQCRAFGSPPAASPWGELPLTYMGGRYPVQLRHASLPTSARAGAGLSISLDVSIPAGAPQSDSLVVEVHSAGIVVLRQAFGPIRIRPSRRTTLNLAVRISPFAPPGRYEVVAGLRRSTYGTRGLRLGDLTILPSGRAGKVTTATVRRFNGAPTLHLNGKPVPAVWFYQSNPNRRDLAALHEEGIDVLTYDIPMGWTGPGKSSLTDTDSAIQKALDANPEAYIVPRLWLMAPGWWLDQHPGEITRMGDGTGYQDNGLGGTRHESFASVAWRREASAALARFVRHVQQSPYSDRVIGYHIGNGIYTEWHAWSSVNYPDTSEPMRLRLAALARKRYGSTDRLRGAWGMPDVTFKTIRCPTVAERLSGDVGVFRDPSRSRFVTDYYEAFHSATVESLLAFCRTVKETTRNRAITLAFYGYLPDLDWPQEGDHRALAQLLKSPDIDCLASPHSYERRGLGGDGLFRNHPASAQLHGKLFLDEGDDRTYLANDPQFTHVKTEAESVAILRREAVNAATHNTGLWYMDQQGQWFARSSLVAEIGRARRLSLRMLTVPRDRTAQVAVIVSPESEFAMAGRGSQLNRITYPLFSTQVGEICKAGAPFDVYLVDDLANPAMRRYRLYIMLNCFSLTDAQRKAALARVRAPGVTALWFYAPGYVTATGLSVEAASAITGMSLECRTEPAIQQVITPDQRSFGPNSRQSPTFSVADRAATVLGHYRDGGVGYAWTAIGAARSIFCGVPNLPAEQLRRLYRQAGVHIYLGTGDWITANRSLLGLHTSSAGPKEIRLPERATVVDALTGRTVARNTDHFTITCGRFETRIYTLATAGKAHP